RGGRRRRPQGAHHGNHAIERDPQEGHRVDQRHNGALPVGQDNVTWHKAPAWCAQYDLYSRGESPPWTVMTGMDAAKTPMLSSQTTQAWQVHLRVPPEVGGGRSSGKPVSQFGKRSLAFGQLPAG